MIKTLKMLDQNSKMRSVDKVKLNVGGVRFETLSSTLLNLPHTLLSNVGSCAEFYDSVAEEYFFDRNPLVFHFILEAYRTGKLHVPHDICGTIMRTEMEFWGLTPAMLDECCWKNFYKYDDDLKIIHALKGSCYTGLNTNFLPEQELTLQTKIWLFLDEPRSCRGSLLYGLLMMMTVLISLLCNCIESLPVYRVPVSEETIPKVDEISAFFESTNRSVSEKVEMALSTNAVPVVLYTDMVVNAILTFDITARLLFCPNFVCFFKSCLNVMDVVVILAYWTRTGVVYVWGRSDATVQWVLFVCECLLVLKVFRLLRMCKYMPTLHVMHLSLMKSKSSLFLLFVVEFIGIVTFGTFIYAAEFSTPDIFPDLFTSMWWAAVTLTTVGYGDHVPKSPPGYVVGVVCAIWGLFMLSLPAALITANFTSYQTHYNNAIKQKKEENAK